MAFPDGFHWGVATSAHQIEGAPLADGACESIWHRFAHTPGKVARGENADVACDHYHRWKDDIALMKELGIRAYRFSVAWPRIMPGPEIVNRSGIDFYSRLVDALLEAGITPFLTLFHWDLPQWLQDEGGWANRTTAVRFASYAEVVARALGSRVRHWITLNEPVVYATEGHLEGVHAPGVRDDPKAMLAVSHHLLLGHGLALPRIRVHAPGARIGPSLLLTSFHPASERPEDRTTCARFDGWHNRWYLEPILLGRYPQDLLAWNSAHLPRFDEIDLAVISQPVDFIGFNYYKRFGVAFDEKTKSGCSGYFCGRHAPPEGAALTDLGWDTYPAGLYEWLTRLRQEYGNPPVFITENGLGMVKGQEDGEHACADLERIEFLRDHLLQAERAIEEGSKLAGYFVWSLLDNFEWASGYGPRFGLVHVDYSIQRRTLKESAKWYARVIRSGGEVHRG